MAEKRDTYSSEESTGDAGRRSSPTGQGAPASSRSAVRDAAKNRPTTAAEFDRMFDDGEDIDHLIDWSKVKLAGAANETKRPKRVNVDFPAAMMRKLDEYARRRGMTRQALIGM